MLSNLSEIKHAIHVLILLSMVFAPEIYYSALKSWYPEHHIDQFDPAERYGKPMFYFLYFLRIIPFFNLPIILFNFCGLLFYNAYKPLPESIGSDVKVPLICVRTVTRGDYPDLVRCNVLRNIATCQEAGLKNFVVEIVTQKSFNVPNHPNIRMIVVPEDYIPRSGTLYKARNLQYCLEEGVSPVKDDEWIVHLDEDSILTRRSVCGIVKFATSDKHPFGQGVVTYGNEGDVNWLTTLADSVRVSDDHGKLRFQFKIFHRPILGWKGSYMVAKAKAEKDVTFDNGLDGCVLEDFYFGLNAFQKGYSFDFIDGEIWEKSPFTIMDMLRQRKRWFQGVYLVVRSKNIMPSVKFFVATSLYSSMAMSFCLLNSYFVIAYPFPANHWVNLLCASIGGQAAFMYMFGTLKSFKYRPIGFLRYCLLIVMSFVAMPLSISIEFTAMLWGMFTEKHKFYVVKKEVPKHNFDAII